MDHTIRLANADDAEALSLLGAATVLETYTTILPGADLLTFCRTKHSVAHYAAWLADPHCTIWIAQARLGAPIGYLVLTPASLPVEGPSPGDLEVMRVYVLQCYHKAGIGHALIQRAVAEAQSRHAPRLVLGMHNDNTRALAFYRRQGFEIIAARRFVVGNSVCCDSVLALPIKTGE
jgi:ribosomal protein S18 acetylase RimI-like enzyme